jgi:hypothetical protein
MVRTGVRIMAETKLEVTAKLDTRMYFYTYPLTAAAQREGFALKLISAPPSEKQVKPGWWLNHWETADGKRVFDFGPDNPVIFASKDGAIATKEELEKKVDIITEVVDIS